MIDLKSSIAEEESHLDKANKALQNKNFDEAKKLLELIKNHKV